MNIFISDLDENIQDVHLKDAFKEYGLVTKTKVIKDRDTGKSRGFGFIEMPNICEAVNAINKLDGGTWEGKIIAVKKALK